MDSHFLEVAYVSKSHGIKGELFIQPVNSKADWPKALSSIKIGKKIFSIEKLSIHKQGFIVKLKDCNTKKSADQLKSQPVFLSKDYFSSQKGNEIYLTELTHFKIKVLGYGELGEILGFQSDKHQDFLVVAVDGSVDSNQAPTCLIPVASSYIKKIDFKKKELVLSLPDNFLSVFTNIH